VLGMAGQGKDLNRNADQGINAPLQEAYDII
jgi:hypothetical protein